MVVLEYPHEGCCYVRGMPDVMTAGPYRNHLETITDNVEEVGFDYATWFVGR